jgi:hypothetical protein
MRADKMLRPGEIYKKEALAMAMGGRNSRRS